MGLKFLANMPISPKTVDFLKSTGYEALRVDEVGMKEAEDEEILEYAYRNNLVVVTMDLDYGGILASRGLPKPSVITFRLGNPDVNRVNKILKEKLPEIEEDLGKGSLVTVEDDRVRVRELPI